MSSNLKVNTILPSVGSNIGLGTNGGNLNVDGGCKVQVGTALTLGHTVGVQFATQNLHSAGFEVNQINASGIITASHFYGNGSNLTGITQTTINNNANNRVITGSGTANTLEAESNLTFTGSILTVTNSSGASELTLVTPSNTDGGVYFNDGSNSGALSYNHSDDSMRFRVNATEKLRITSSGALGTKSTVRSANGGLDLCAQGATNLGTLTLGAGGGQNGQSRSSNQENQFRIMMPTYANPANMTTVLYGTSGSAGHDLHYGGGTGWSYATNTHRFFTTANQSTGNGTERLRITSDGNIGAGGITSPLWTSGGGIHLNDNYGIGFGNGGSGRPDFQLMVTDGSTLQFRCGFGADTADINMDTSGRLLIGTTATDDRDGYNSALQIGGTSGDTASMSIGRYSANVSYPSFVFSKSRNATVNGHTRINTGDYLGGIQFQGDDGARFLVGASIVAQAASPVADYDMATDLIISTNSGTTSPNKSMTLDHQGRFTKPNTPFVMVHINSRTDWATTGSFMTIPWDTIHGRSTNSNKGSHFNTSNYRFTAPVDGRYMFVMSLNIVGDNIIYHRINGTNVSGGEYRLTPLVWDHADASFIYDMNANDYYDTVSRLYDGSGKRWNGGGNSDYGWDTLSIYLLG